jgi:hypothetical protein
MTTFRLADTGALAGRAREIVDAIIRREKGVFGVSTLSNI